MPDEPDLTARLIGLREILSSEIQYTHALAVEKINSLSIERSILLDGLNTRTSDLKTLLDERHEAQSTAMRTAFEAADKAVQAALAAAEKATIKAEVAADKRFDGVNELRGQLQDVIATFMTQAEATARFDSLAEKLDLETKRTSAAVIELDRRITDSLGRLELRLTSRLDQGEGAGTGAAKARTEQQTVEQVRIHAAQARLQAYGLIIAALVLVIGAYATFHK